MGFIQNHTDYISFLSGLTFFVLASISLVQKFAGENRISWHWLAGFGVLHGLHEWLGVLLRAFEISHLFASFDQLLILASFLALAEFARLNWDKVLIKSTTETQRRSPWILMAGFLVGAALSALRLESVLNGLIFIVVTGAAAWTSALFIRIGQQSNTIGRNSLYLSAGAVALYGLSESLFTLLINSLWFSSLNLAPLTQATSILEAWHGILAFCATIGLWIFIHPEPASKGQDNTANKSSNRYTLWLFTSLLLVLIAGGYATEYLGQKTMESIRGRSHGATEILASHLRDEMARTDLMANLLAKSPLILPALEKRDSESLQQAETALRQHTAVLESSLAFLMAPNGTVVLSTDNSNEGAQKGENFGFLPYFQDSSAYGLVGKDLAVEPRPGQRGYFVSHPVSSNNGSLKGVAVVKKILAQTDKEFKRYKNWFLISPDGIIFLSSRPELLLKPMWSLSENNRLQLMKSGYLGKGPFTEAVFTKEAIDNSEIDWQGGKALINIVGVRPDGWSAVIIEELNAVALQRLFGIGVTLSVALFILCFFIVVQRESAYERRMADDQERLKVLNEKLELQATTDPLTGASNRLKFDSVLAAEIDRATRYGANFALVMFDVDHFKRINDGYGHQVGDMVLENLARLTRETMRRSDVFARWGGEEFMVLLPMTPFDGPISFTERLRAAIAHFVFEPVPSVTCSFGVSEFVPGDTAETLIKRVDVALYWAKERGRNRVEVNMAEATKS